jgi:hypothetical protein
MTPAGFAESFYLALLSRDNRDQLTVAVFVELHLSLREGVDGEILAKTHVLTRVKAGASLTHDYVAGYHVFATELLHAEALAVTVAPVP